MPNNRTVFNLLLIPAPWFCEDFIPTWLMASLSAILFLRIFRSLPQWFSLLLCLGLGALCFKTFGIKLVPESAVSFLSLMIAAKLAQKEKRFQTSIILGILWVGAFALFNTTLTYLVYLAAFFLIAIGLLKSEPKATFSLRFKSVGIKPLLALAKTLPLIVALFVFFPRFKGFLPSAAGPAGQSQVGYSKSIDNSNSGNLAISNKTAFYAETSRRLPQENLYWRGRVHTITDGYNWRPKSMPSERELPVAKRLNSFRYELRFEQDLGGDLVLLEVPLRVEDAKESYYALKGENVYRSYRKDKKLSITAISNLDAKLQGKLERNKKSFLQLPEFLPKVFTELSTSIQEKDPDKIIRQFASSLKKQGFQYSLTPGTLPNLASFLDAKRGFCTHYASLLGILLRHKGIPARLVSGFQGGEYNEDGGFYTVRSSDAHAWVEYHANNAWHRVDPTSFVSPARIQEGTAAVLEKGQAFSWKFATNAIPFLNELNQYISNLNYKLTLFLDDYDRQAQALLAQKLSLELKSFYRLGAGLCLLLLAFLAFIARRHSKSLKPEDKLFKKFCAKLSRRGLQVSASMSESAIMRNCDELDLPSECARFLELYQNIKYGDRHELVSKLSQSLKRI